MITQMRARKDPDHIRRAERCNEEIDKRKTALRGLKGEKDKVKRAILGTIDDIFDHNNKSETVLKRRHEYIGELFGGAEDLPEFDNLIKNLEVVLSNKKKKGKDEQLSLKNLRRL